MPLLAKKLALLPKEKPIERQKEPIAQPPKDRLTELLKREKKLRESLPKVGGGKRKNIEAELSKVQRAIKLERLKRREEKLIEELKEAQSEPMRTVSKILDIERKLYNVQQKLRELTGEGKDHSELLEKRRLRLVEMKRELERRLQKLNELLGSAEEVGSLRRQFILEDTKAKQAKCEEETAKHLAERDRLSKRIKRLEKVREELRDELAAVERRIRALGRSHEEKDLARRARELVEVLGLKTELELKGAERLLFVIKASAAKATEAAAEAQEKGLTEKARILGEVARDRTGLVEKATELIEVLKNGKNGKAEFQKERLLGEIEAGIASDRYGVTGLYSGESLGLFGARAVYEEAEAAFISCRERMLEAREEGREEDARSNAKRFKELRNALENAGELLGVALELEQLRLRNMMTRFRTAVRAQRSFGEMFCSRLNYAAIRGLIEELKKADLYLDAVVALEGAVESGSGVRPAIEACQAAFGKEISGDNFARYKKWKERLDGLVEDAEALERRLDGLMSTPHKSARRLAAEREAEEDRKRDNRRIFEKLSEASVLPVAVAVDILKHSTQRKLAREGVVAFMCVRPRAGQKLAIGYDADDKPRVIVQEKTKPALVFLAEVRMERIRGVVRAYFEAALKEFDFMMARRRRARIAELRGELEAGCAEVSERVGRMAFELDQTKAAEMGASIEDYLGRARKMEEGMLERGGPSKDDVAEFEAFVQLRLRDLAAMGRELDAAEREFKSREVALARGASAAVLAMAELRGVLGEFRERPDGSRSFVLGAGLRPLAAVCEERSEFADRKEQAKLAMESFARAMALIAEADFETLYGKELEEKFGEIEGELSRLRGLINELSAAQMVEDLRAGLREASGTLSLVSQLLATRKAAMEGERDVQWKRLGELSAEVQEGVEQFKEGMPVLPRMQKEYQRMADRLSAAVAARDVRECAAALVELEMALSPHAADQALMGSDYGPAIVRVLKAIGKMEVVGMVRIPYGLSYISLLNRNAEEAVALRLGELRNEMQRVEEEFREKGARKEDLAAKLKGEQELEELAKKQEAKLGELEGKERELDARYRRAKAIKELGLEAEDEVSALGIGVVGTAEQERQHEERKRERMKFTRQLNADRSGVLAMLYDRPEDIPEWAWNSQLNEAQYQTLRERAIKRGRDAQAEISAIGTEFMELRSERSKVITEQTKAKAGLREMKRAREELARTDAELVPLRSRISKLERWIEWLGVLKDKITHASKCMGRPESMEGVFTCYQQMENNIAQINELVRRGTFEKGDPVLRALSEVRDTLVEFRRMTWPLGALHLRAMERSLDEDGRPMSIRCFYLEHADELESRRPEFLERLIERYRKKPNSLVAALRYLSVESADEVEKTARAQDAVAVSALLYVWDRREALKDSLDRLWDLPEGELADHLLSSFDNPAMLYHALEVYSAAAAKSVEDRMHEGTSFLAWSVREGRSLGGFLDDPENKQLMDSPRTLAVRLMEAYPADRHRGLACALNLLGHAEAAMLVRGAAHLAELRSQGVDLEGLLEQAKGSTAESIGQLVAHDPRPVSLLAALRFLERKELADALARWLREREPKEKGPSKSAAAFVRLAQP